jgi:hypothetical protein
MGLSIVIETRFWIERPLHYCQYSRGIIRNTRPGDANLESMSDQIVEFMQQLIRHPPGECISLHSLRRECDQVRDSFMICAVQPLVVRKDVPLNTLQEVITTFTSGQPLSECCQIVTGWILECTEFFVL